LLAVDPGVFSIDIVGVFVLAGVDVSCVDLRLGFAGLLAGVFVDVAWSTGLRSDAGEARV
jgi:hypothetical protein